MTAIRRRMGLEFSSLSGLMGLMSGNVSVREALLVYFLYFSRNYNQIFQLLYEHLLRRNIFVNFETSNRMQPAVSYKEKLPS